MLLLLRKNYGVSQLKALKKHSEFVLKEFQKESKEKERKMRSFLRDKRNEMIQKVCNSQKHSLCAYCYARTVEREEGNCLKCSKCDSFFCDDCYYSRMACQIGPDCEHDPVCYYCYDEKTVLFRNGGLFCWDCVEERV